MLNTKTWKTSTSRFRNKNYQNLGSVLEVWAEGSWKRMRKSLRRETLSQPVT